MVRLVGGVSAIALALHSGGSAGRTLLVLGTVMAVSGALKLLIK